MKIFDILKGLHMPLTAQRQAAKIFGDGSLTEELMMRAAEVQERVDEGALATLEDELTLQVYERVCKMQERRGVLRTGAGASGLAAMAAVGAGLPFPAGIVARAITATAASAAVSEFAALQDRETLRMLSSPFYLLRSEFMTGTSGIVNFKYLPAVAVDAARAGLNHMNLLSFVLREHVPDITSWEGDPARIERKAAEIMPQVNRAIDWASAEYLRIGGGVAQSLSSGDEWLMQKRLAQMATREVALEDLRTEQAELKAEFDISLHYLNQEAPVFRFMAKRFAALPIEIEQNESALREARFGLPEQFVAGASLLVTAALIHGKRHGRRRS